MANTNTNITASTEITDIIKAAIKDNKEKREKMRVFSDDEDQLSEIADDDWEQKFLSWEQKFLSGAKIVMGATPRIDALRAEDAERSSRQKGKLCRTVVDEEGHFVKGKKTTCRDGCGYAHNKEELVVHPARSFVQRTKTKICRSVEQGDECPHGVKCRYAHDASELVSSTPSGTPSATPTRDRKMTMLCKSVVSEEDGSFLAPDLHAECPHGDNCNFAHSLETLRTLECNFGERCRNVYRKSADCWLNCDGAKSCIGYHPGENYLSHYCRQAKPLAVKPLAVKPLAVKPLAVKPLAAKRVVSWSVEKAPETVDLVTLGVFKAKVPEALYIKVMEMAIATGKYSEYDIATY